MVSVRVVSFGLIVLVAVSIVRAEESPGPLETAEVMVQVKEECRNSTGDDKAFKELVSVMQSDTPRCFMQYVNMSYLRTPVGELGKTEQVKVLGSICDQLKSAVVCVDPVVDKIKPCIEDEDDMELLTTVVNTIPEALQMICNNSGAMLLELTEPLSRSCVVELAPTIDDCMDLVSDGTMKMDMDSYGVNECKEITTMRDCFAKKIRDCGALAFLKLFELFYGNMLALTPCK